MAGIADRDGDQRITREEFVTGAVRRLRDNPDSFAEIARPFAARGLAVAGADADGRIGVADTGARAGRVPRTGGDRPPGRRRARHRR